MNSLENKKLKNFLIIANETKDPGLKWTNTVLVKLETRGAKTALLMGKDLDGLTNNLAGIHCVIVIGGDGTMLRVAQALKGCQVPVIGVNLGVVGFMTEVVVSEIDNMIDRLLSGDYMIEDRMLLSGTVRSYRYNKDNNSEVRSEHTHSVDALNDIVLARENSLRLIAVRIEVNGKYFDTIEADGIIISTPTGSTSYNLSAGGPIVQPDARLMVMTPIAPYSMSKRSVVFGADDKIALELVEKRKNSENIGLVSFDGANNFHMELGDKVEISASENIFRLIKFDEASVYEILKKKIEN